MDKVYEELDELKSENEKIKADYKRKAELFENLKKTQNEQLIKIQEANSVIEKQGHELDEKTAEISELRQVNQDLKRSLNEKTSILKRVSAANDKLRADGEEKYHKCEEEKGRLLLDLEEANEKTIDLQQKINVYRAEIEGLKGLLSASKKKCVEAEKNAKAPKELRDRDDMLIRLEEEKSKVEEKLKWKMEQFRHLEEAHEKLRNQFKASKKDWEQERSTLVDEISLLQTKLDSQIRISEDLQKKLQMCNNALTHEETRRKYLEVQVSEFKARYEDVFTECQDTKSQLDCLAAKRDKEVAALRHSLSTKEAYYKEMEYQKGKLEQENRELLVSIKELQEASIHGSGNSSLAKLKNKLRSVEQLHKNCSANLKSKEVEWSARMENMMEELNNYRSQLEFTETALKELELELEDCFVSAVQMKLQCEETSVVSLVLKSIISEAQLKLADAQEDIILHKTEGQRRISELVEQLEQKNMALAKAQRDVEEDREKAACLLRRVESLGATEDHQLQMRKEIERYKEMLEESVRCQTRLKEQAKEIESDYKEKLREVCDALDAANSDLAEEREKAAVLARQVESFDVVEEKQKKEIGRHKERLEESSKRQLHLEEKASQLEKEFEEKIRELQDALESANSKLAEANEKRTCMETKMESIGQIEEQRLLMQKELERYKEKVEQVERNSRRELKEVFEALEMANSELSEKTCEAHRLEFESWLWKSIAERFKADLEENQNLRKNLEASLLAQVEVGEVIKQERDDLVCKLEAASSARMETTTLESEKEMLLKIMREKDKVLEDLQQEIEWLEKESFRRELEGVVFAHITMEKTSEKERENLSGLLGQKEQKFTDLEQKFKSSLKSLSSQLAQKQAEVNTVYQAWEKLVTAEILAELEIEEKKLMVVGLEADICTIKQKLEKQEKSLSCFQQQALETEAELETKRKELKELTDQMQVKLRTSDALVDKLSNEKDSLVQEISRLSSERENLLSYVGELDNSIVKLSNEDAKLMVALNKMLKSVDNGGCFRASRVDDEFSNLAKENMNDLASPQAMKKYECIPEERSPFRLLN